MSPALLLRRLLLAIPTLFGVAVVVFVLLRIVPGDPIAMMVPGEATPEDIARLRASYGLDKSIPVQFVLYLGQLLQGNFGVSISLKQDVLALVLGRLPATLELAGVAITLAVVCGVTLALAATYWRGSWMESAVDGVNSVSLAIPEFLWALLLILAFAVLMPLFPISARSGSMRPEIGNSGISTAKARISSNAQRNSGIASATEFTPSARFSTQVPRQ